MSNCLNPQLSFETIMERAIENITALAKAKFQKDYFIKKVEYEGAKINIKNHEIQWPYFTMETIAKQFAIIVMGESSLEWRHNGTIEWRSFNNENEYNLWMTLFSMSQRFIILHEICHALFPREKLSNATDQIDKELVEEFFCDIQASHLLFKSTESHIIKHGLGPSLLSDLYIAMRLYWFCKDSTGELIQKENHPPAISRVGYCINYALAIQEKTSRVPIFDLKDYETKEGWLINRIVKVEAAFNPDPEATNNYTKRLENDSYRILIDYNLTLPE